jgi:L-aminopeptidase/D-esterase-like protein
VEAGEGVLVGALVVVNAFGDVIDEDGRVIAGLREGPRSRKLARTADALKSPGWGRGGAAPPFGHSTVIGVVATNARFGREDLARIAGMAHDGIARAVAPAHTLFDGDTIFALAAGEREGDATAVGTAAAEAVAAAVRRGVLQASPLGGVPSCARARSNART